MKNHPLAGQLETITMMELRLRIGEVILQVKMGKTFILTHQGKRVAVVQPLPADLVTIINSDGTLDYEIAGSFFNPQKKESP